LCGGLISVEMVVEVTTFVSRELEICDGEREESQRLRLRGECDFIVVQRGEQIIATSYIFSMYPVDNRRHEKERPVKVYGGRRTSDERVNRASRKIPAGTLGPRIGNKPRNGEVRTRKSEIGGPRS
jgi:hypothetical protein